MSDLIHDGAEMDERRPVPGWEGFYEISRGGILYSAGRILKYKNVSYFKKGRILKCGKNQGGYRQFVGYPRGHAPLLTVHRAVALAFVPLVEGKPHLNHIDGDKLNNKASNLEWVTREENIDHYLANVRQSRPSPLWKKRLLTHDLVLEFVKRKNEGYDGREIAKHFNVPWRAVYLVLSGTRWSNVTGIEKKRTKCATQR